MARDKKPTEKRVARPTKPKPATGKAKTSPPRKAKPAVKPVGVTTGPSRIYTLDVSLLSGPITKQFARKNQSVVRTIQIRGDQTLEQLHEAIPSGNRPAAACGEPTDWCASASRARLTRPLPRPS